MQPRISGFAAITSLVFLVASDLVVAQVTAPNCSDSWKWSYNSLNQNPCKVGAYLMSTCNGSTFDLPPLPQGADYEPAPTICSVGADECMCNNVVYNLISACDGCQGQKWATWAEYSSNCMPPLLPPSTFPNPVPADTRIPQWAIADTTNLNFWNATTAQGVGDLPEILEGYIVGPSSATTVTASDSATASTSAPTASSSVSTPSNSFKKSSKTGAIAGGVTGGVVAIAFIGGLVYYSLRQRPHQPDGPFQLLKRTPSKMS